tara:strand:- start:71 stop:349 length:279 start_codon:yes stop_codon:yes gene_type:complete
VVVEELVGQWDLEEVEDLEVDLVEEFLIMEETDNRVNNQETQELTDTETQGDQDNIHTTVQAVVELLMVDSQDQIEVVEKAETAEMEDQMEL